VVFVGLPPLDRVVARVTISGEDAVESTPISTNRTHTFSLIPWIYLALVVVVGLAVAMVVRSRPHEARGDLVPPSIVDRVPSPPSERLTVP
jgi:hypothetical protein